MCKYCKDPDHYYGPYEKEADRVARLLEFLESEDEMDIIPNNKSKEPALKVGAATGTVSGLLFLVAYFFPGTVDEKNAQVILVATSFLLPIVTAAFTRGRVWSPKSVQEVLDTAVEDAKAQIPQKKLPRQ